LDARGRRSTASNARSRHENPRDRTKAKTDSVSGPYAKNYPDQTRSGTKGEAEMILRTVIGLIALLVSSAAQSNYFTYQSWLAMPESSRVAYLSGAFDSLVSFAETEQVAMHYVREMHRRGQNDKLPAYREYVEFCQGQARTSHRPGAGRIAPISKCCLRSTTDQIALPCSKLAL